MPPGMLDRAVISLAGIVAPRAAGDAVRRSYQRALEDFFGTGAATAHWKGRVALYVILKALGIGPGDDVLVPGYTCVMVPGPIMYLGARPVYVDIDPERYVSPAKAVIAALTPRTRAILVQHTYGLPAPVLEIRRTADARGIPVIEDCCHTLGGRVDGRLLGSLGTAAFFSGQWNKPFSTGLGGLALVHDAALAERVRAEQAALPAPGRKAAWLLACQLLVYEACIFPATTALATRAFRWLTHKGLVIGSSSRAEFEPIMPAGYALRPTHVQCQLGRAEIARLTANLAHRRRLTALYRRELPLLGFRVPPLEPGWDVPLLRFPLRVANKSEALAQAARHGVEIGSWFECPLHPAETDQAAFGYVAGQCPAAERAAAEVINLPTHRRVGPRALARTMEFVRRVCRPL
jgi:perosamine synthetase